MSDKENVTGEAGQNNQQSTEFANQGQGFGQNQGQSGGLPLGTDMGTEGVTGTDPGEIDSDPPVTGTEDTDAQDGNLSAEVEEDNMDVGGPDWQETGNTDTPPDSDLPEGEGDDFPEGETPADPGGDTL